MGDRPDSIEHNRAADAAALASVGALGALLHGPWLDRAFGPMEINGANYFGVFARNWERFGFGELRGVPLGFRDLDAVAQGSPYWTHPPGFAWLTGMLGSAEWQLRLPTAIGHVIAALAVFVLLRARLSLRAAWVGGIATLAVPILSFYSLASYENAVLPLGLLAWIALLARSRGTDRAPWWVLLTVCSLVGPWMDWAYGFFVVAMLPLVASRSWRATVRALALPWCVSLASLLAVFGWMAWASGADGLPQTDFASLLAGMVGKSSVAGGFTWERMFENLRLGFSIPVLAIAVCGLPVFAARAPRLASAMLIAGVLNFVAFPANTAAHVFYWAYLAPLVAAGLAGLAQVRFRRGPISWVLPAIAVGAVAFAAVRTFDHFRAADTPFFREQGELVTAATRDGDRSCLVFTNYAYGFYVRSPLAVMGLPSVTDPIKLAALLDRPGYEDYGVRYVLTELSGPPVGGAPLPSVDPELVQYLERYPSVPSLERAVTIPGYDVAATFRCRTFTLRE